MKSRMVVDMLMVDRYCLVNLILVVVAMMFVALLGHSSSIAIQFQKAIYCGSGDEANGMKTIREKVVLEHNLISHLHTQQKKFCSMQAQQNLGIANNPKLLFNSLHMRMCPNTSH